MVQFPSMSAALYGSVWRCMALREGLKAGEMHQVKAEVSAFILANLVMEDAGRAGREG